MRKKSGFTIVEQAIESVPVFEKVVRKLEQQVTLRGQSQSTLNNYIMCITLFPLPAIPLIVIGRISDLQADIFSQCINLAEVPRQP